jgi:biopolymer transport protein ExbD
MGRFRDGTASSSDEPGIDMSPLMDCVFILLIFFIVTTTFVEETGVDVDRPQAAASSQLDKNSILIAVTPEGEVVHGGQNIGVSGVRPLIKRLLQQEDMPVIIQADRKSTTGVLISVLDAARLAGAKDVSVATQSGS